MLTRKQIDGLRLAPATYIGHSGTHYHLLSETGNAALCDMASQLLDAIDGVEQIETERKLT